MSYIFKLPDVGEGMAEGEIVSWLVKVGDHVDEGQAILELQNDKLMQEILSPYTGTVSAIKVAAGAVAKVGEPLIEFDGDMNSTASQEETNSHEEKIENKQVTKTPILSSSSQRVMAMPSVRRFAHQNKIDITKIKGSGKFNHVTIEDIKKVMHQTSEPVEAIQEEIRSVNHLDSLETTVEAMSAIRKATSKAMTIATSNVPHVTVMDEVDVTKLVEHRSKFKEMAQAQGIKLTYLPYIVKALSVTAQKYPILNSSVNTEDETIIYHNVYNVGIAVDTAKGLLVPNIKNANHYSILALAKKIQGLSDAANTSKLTATDIADGTITITNIGSLGGSWFTPIIHYPEVAILGMGRIQKQPIVDEHDQIVVAHMLRLSLSFDHRIIDGALAQRVMNELKRLLSNPDLLLMEV